MTPVRPGNYDLVQKALATYRKSAQRHLEDLAQSSMSNLPPKGQLPMASEMVFFSRRGPVVWLQTASCHRLWMW